MTTFRCPSKILITSWLFTARWSTWRGNHLAPCVAELVGSCIPIHAHRCLPDPKCLFYPSGLSLCLSVDQFGLVPVNDMVLFHGMVCDGWLVSNSNCSPLPWRLGSVYQLWKSPLLSCVPWSSTEHLHACLSNIWAGAVLARHTIDQFGLLFILDLVLRMNHKVPQRSVKTVSCGDAVRFQNSCKCIAQFISHMSDTTLWLPLVFFDFFDFQVSAPSSCKQSRRDQDVRRTSKRCH